METFERICSIISSQMGLSSDFELSRETTWQEFDADSLDLVEIAMSVEDEFEIEIPDEALSKMQNLGDLVTYIENE